MKSIPAFHALLAVCRTGSMRAAAAQLNITQSGLSRRIQELQSQLGVTLFEPQGRGVRPTRAALDLLPHVRAAVAAVEAVHDHAAAAPRLPQPLRIAATPQSIAGIVAPALALCDRSILTPRLMETGGAHVISAVTNGEADVGLTSHPPIDSGVHRADVCALTLMAIPPAGCRAPAPVSIRDLAEQDLLVLDPGFQSRRMLEAAFNLERLTPRIAFEGQSIPTLLALADAGLGWAIAPSHAIGGRPGRPVLSLGQPIRMDLSLIWSPAAQRTPMLAELRRHLTGPGQGFPHGAERRLDQPVGG